jgi:hypothetical protein
MGLAWRALANQQLLCTKQQQQGAIPLLAAGKAFAT